MPVIAQVHGAALGGGAGLAAVADIAVAADDATFGFTEVKLGLIPAVIAPYVLAKIGQSAARELFITGRRFDAAHARSIGLVHAVVPADELIDRVNKYLIEIATNGPEAMSAAKALIRRIANRSIAEVAPITAEAIAERRVSDEAQKMMKGFLKNIVGSRSRQSVAASAATVCGAGGMVARTLDELQVYRKAVVASDAVSADLGQAQNSRADCGFSAATSSLLVGPRMKSDRTLRLLMDDSI